MVLLRGEALRDALAEIDWSNPSATVSLGAQSLVITVDSTSGFSYEVSARARACVGMRHRRLIRLVGR